LVIVIVGLAWSTFDASTRETQMPTGEQNNPATAATATLHRHAAIWPLVQRGLL
jgi:hypothetical protein